MPDDNEKKNYEITETKKQIDKQTDQEREYIKLTIIVLYYTIRSQIISVYHTVKHNSTTQHNTTMSTITQHNRTQPNPTVHVTAQHYISQLNKAQDSSI